MGRTRVGWDMTKSELQKIIKLKITVEPIKKCWFIRKDWSIYTTIGKKRAHRVTYELCVGPVMPDRVICHKCDRKGCINPDHLFQGTQSDNMKDARRKGRSKWGIKCQ
jgi:hypothetical protein